MRTTDDQTDQTDQVAGSWLGGDAGPRASVAEVRTEIRAAVLL